jgi:hypothetical protein
LRTGVRPPGFDPDLRAGGTEPVPAAVSVDRPIDGTEDPVQVGVLTRSARNGGYMSTTLTFTRVTAEELDRAIEDPEWALECVQDEDALDCFLEKSWAGIQFLLDEAGVNVELHESGFIIDDEFILSGWSDSMVAEAAKALKATPFEVLAGHYDPRKLSEAEVYPFRQLWDDADIEYLRDNYADLVEFFEETAADLVRRLPGPVGGADHRRLRRGPLVRRT